MSETTTRDALAKAYCQHRDCCEDGCYAGRRFADEVTASGVVDTHPTPCETCGGDGVTGYQPGPHPASEIDVPCPDCAGEGE